MNLDNLVTKDYLAAQFAEQNARVDTRFAEQDASIDTRFAEQRSYMDTRFATLEARMDSNFRVFTWTQAIVVAAVILPHLERLMSL